DRAQGARVDPLLLEGVLEGEGVDHGREHAGVVGGCALHAARGGGGAAPDIAAADDDGDADTELGEATDLLGDFVQHLGVDAEAALAHEGFAAELEYHRSETDHGELKVGNPRAGARSRAGPRVSN